MTLRSNLRTLLTLGSVTFVCSAVALAQPAGNEKSAPHGRPHAGGLFDRLDQDGNGKIEQAEARAAATALFGRMDKNGDGAVSREEQADVPHRKAGKKDSGDHFARMDKNGDGKIERGETRMPEEHFVRADANKDGKLTKEELKAAFEARVQARRTEHFAEFDGNKDGKIDRNEALAHADRRFAELDSNKDGKVTKDEARQGMGKHHGKRGGHHDCGEGEKREGGKKGAAAKGKPA